MIRKSWRSGYYRISIPVLMRKRRKMLFIDGLNQKNKAVSLIQPWKTSIEGQFVFSDHVNQADQMNIKLLKLIGILKLNKKRIFF